MFVQCILVPFDMLFRARTRPIDALGTDVNAPSEFQRLRQSAVFDRLLLRIRNIDVFVEEEDVHGEIVADGYMGAGILPACIEN